MRTSGSIPGELLRDTPIDSLRVEGNPIPGLQGDVCYVYACVYVCMCVWARVIESLWVCLLFVCVCVCVPVTVPVPECLYACA